MFPAKPPERPRWLHFRAAAAARRNHMINRSDALFEPGFTFSLHMRNALQRETHCGKGDFKGL
jgi:hypothetical protein